MPSSKGESSTLAAFVKNGGGVELRNVPLPKLAPGAIKVKMMASGVCGTDLEKLTGMGITSTILGHEVSGIVTESESSVFVRGDRVVPHHHVACNECVFCRAGAGTMCEGFKTSNFIPGGFSDEFIVPAYNVSHGGVHKIREDLSFEEASLAEPLACCLRGLTHAGVFSSPPTNVLIVGAGPIGLLHMELMRSAVQGVKLTAVDVLSTRLDFAEKHEEAYPVRIVGANGSFSETALKNADGIGYDLAIVATGNPAAFAESIKCLRKSGKLLLFGAPHKGSAYSLDLSNFFLNELNFTSSYSATEKELGQAIDLLERRKIQVQKFITSKIPLQNIEDAMSTARNESQVKVVVIP